MQIKADIMKLRDRDNRITFTALIAPFVAYLCMVLWFNFASNPFTDAVSLNVSSPLWWQRLGLSDDNWLDAGLLPGAVCGLLGIIVVVMGAKNASGKTVASGIWACLAAPVIVLLYMAATF